MSPRDARDPEIFGIPNAMFFIYENQRNLRIKCISLAPLPECRVSLDCYPVVSVAKLLEEASQLIAILTNIFKKT